MLHKVNKHCWSVSLKNDFLRGSIFEGQDPETIRQDGQQLWIIVAQVVYHQVYTVFSSDLILGHLQHPSILKQKKTQFLWTMLIKTTLGQPTYNLYNFLCTLI